MKKILCYLMLFVAFSYTADAQMILQAKVTTLQNRPVSRVKLKKSGEKLTYRTTNPTKRFYLNTDGSIWKTVDNASIKQTPCANATWANTVNSFSPMQSTNDLEYFYKCPNDNSIGMTDENGKSFFNTNEPVLGDYVTHDNLGFITCDKAISSATDSIKTFKYYKNNNGVLTLAKTFKDVRTALGSFTSSGDAQNIIYQITKDNKVILYDLNFNVLATVPVAPFPNGVQSINIKNVYQKVFNTDSKWEFTMTVYDKDGKSSTYIYDEAGSILLEVKGNTYNNATNTRMIAYSFLENKLYELPGLKLLKTCTYPESLNGFNSKNAAEIYLDNYKIDKTFSVLSENGTVIKKIKITDVAGYDYNNTIYVELPNNSYAFLLYYYSSTTSSSTPNSRLFSVILPDGKIQDFKDYDNAYFSELAGANLNLFSTKVDVAKNEKTTEIYNFGKYVGTNDATEQLTGVSVYPNPFADNIVVQLDNNEQGEVTLSLTNQLGQVLSSQTSNETTINMNGYANYPSGLYFMSVEQNGKKTIQKIVKN